jgi:thiol-disulfide isomerase/thioredoxin
MKRYIFLFPLFVLLVIGCPSGRSGDSGHSGGAPADEGRSSTAQEQIPSSGTSELEKKLGSLGFQIPTEELMAIDFSLRDLSGRETTLSSFAGKVVFLNFWATWCGPCRAEIPSMVQLYAELVDEGFTIVAVNSQELENQVSAFVEEAGMSFPVLLDSSGKVGSAYGVRAIPTTYIIDPQGAIRARMVGTRDWNSPQIISLVRELQP